MSHVNARKIVKPIGAQTACPDTSTILKLDHLKAGKNTKSNDNQRLTSPYSSNHCVADTQDQKDSMRWLQGTSKLPTL
jgi:hypothetical protein